MDRPQAEATRATASPSAPTFAIIVRTNVRTSGRLQRFPSIARTRSFETLKLSPPDTPKRRYYGHAVEILGALEAVIEDRDDELVIVSLRLEVWDH